MWVGWPSWEGHGANETQLVPPMGQWMVLLVPELQAAEQLSGCFPGALAHKGMR